MDGGEQRGVHGLPHLLQLLGDAGVHLQDHIIYLPDLLEDLPEVHADPPAVVHGLDHGAPDLHDLLPQRCEALRRPEVVDTLLQGGEVCLDLVNALLDLVHALLQGGEVGLDLVDAPLQGREGGEQGRAHRLPQPLQLRDDAGVQRRDYLVSQPLHLHHARPGVAVGPHHGGVHVLHLLEERMRLHLLNLRAQLPEALAQFLAEALDELL
mmetsp:Transcript_36445/g.96441  ORF Transcript_36445/g.96441 Transcript_36445/m.96441 type:complete len:210 (-) Transcript_36445:152-781(-)